MTRAYILTYDIADAKRLREMHKLAKAFGRPLQYSVFYCLLRGEDRAKLAGRIGELIDSKQDRVVVLDIGPVPDRESWSPPMEVFGRQVPAASPATIIV
ncbi:MAG: CRISPR-associated endonuclease Cas2 [Candidatus Baltobacteraceae bacterium]